MFIQLTECDLAWWCAYSFNDIEPFLPLFHAAIEPGFCNNTRQCVNPPLIPYFTNMDMCILNRISSILVSRLMLNLRNPKWKIDERYSASTMGFGRLSRRTSTTFDVTVSAISISPWAFIHRGCFLAVRRLIQVQYLQNLFKYWNPQKSIYSPFVPKP
jgi:hypothetical protein